MKKAKLVYVVRYDVEILGVCASLSLARKLAKKHVVELDYSVDKFFIDDLPLITNVFDKVR